MRNRMRFLRMASCCLLFLMNYEFSSAAIKLPAIFGDNMVLQQKMKAPIWGWANAGEKVQVIFQNKLFHTIADNDGKWVLKLNSYKAGGPYEMVIKGVQEQLIIKNILIGDVWVASGQSNMEFPIQKELHGPEAIEKATDTLIHLFFIPMDFKLQPQSDIAAVPDGSFNGKWIVCTPQMLKNDLWASHGFSAVGYYFASQIRLHQQCPVGIICTYVGGTPAQAWTSINGLKQEPAFVNYVTRHQDLIDHLDEAKVSYPQKITAYNDALKQWNEEVGKPYEAITKQWATEVARAKAKGQILPIQPKPSRPVPQVPTPPEGGFYAPGNLYNAMIAPIVPYGIKGVIWYQGESNANNLSDAVMYKQLFPLMIKDWRNNWNQGDFPFLFVQIANFHPPALTPSEGLWPWLREGQLKALSLPKTGMAVITDIGEGNSIHPRNKQDVALRLSLIARRIAYDENLVFSGPLFKSMKKNGNKIRLSFSNIGSGLTTGILQPGTDLQGFGIAGADQQFVWAKAVIEGKYVIVSADGITDPVAVRYNWADNPPGNLYNKDGLPASPFRTDNWAPPSPIGK
jgi:sialate O-acetylesterase